VIPRISKVIPARRITLKEISNLHPESHEEAPMPVTFDFDNDAQTVYETLTDPQFLVDRCIALGELSAECDIEESGSVITIKLVREIKRDLPRALAKVFNPVQTTEMTETWMPNGDNWSGNWVLKVLGQPVTVFGDFELGNTPGGCRYQVSHRARASIPLLGRTIEKYILSQTSEGAFDELGYLRDHLG